MSIAEEIYAEGLSPGKIVELDILDQRDSRVFLKCEYEYNSSDILHNIKRKPAFYLFHDLYNKGIIREGMKLISASSGNFVLNLALKALEYDLKLIAVTPPRIPRENLEALTSLGVDVIHITEEFDMCPRETTVFYTRSLAETYRYLLVNVDQYMSWQNVLAHFFLTWQEIRQEFDRLDYILIALGSTGTYMGVSLGNQVDRVAKEVIGIQPPHSHSIPGVHHIVDGCEWNPEIFSPSLAGKILTVDDIDTYHAMAWLYKEGIRVGPSTSMLFAAIKKLMKKYPGDYLIISPDSDKLYRNHLLRVYRKIYDKLIERYRDDAELINWYVDEIKRWKSIDLPKYIQHHYKQVERGQVYEISKLDANAISNMIIK